MKKLLLVTLATISLYAEATFNQVQNLIDKQEYKQAKLALTIITKNHPDSSKAFYSLAQVNAGLGDLQAARSALDQAQALNPSLSFVPATQVEKLKQAIQPQTELITKVEEPSHWLINSVILVLLALLGFFGYKRFNKPKPIPEEEKPSTKYNTPESVKPKEEPTYKPEPKVYTSEPTRSYEEPNPKVYPTRRVHHYHHNDNSTLATIATAGITAAAVSSVMNHDTPSHTTIVDNISNSWEDKPTHSYEPDNSWSDDNSSSSNSWSDSSSSSNSSWSSSSDSGGSSSWSD